MQVLLKTCLTTNPPSAKTNILMISLSFGEPVFNQVSGLVQTVLLYSNRKDGWFLPNMLMSVTQVALMMMRPPFQVLCQFLHHFSWYTAHQMRPLHP